jgi:hypothetical protein
LALLPFQALFINQVFFFFLLQVRGHSVQGAMLVFPMVSWEKTVCLLFAHFGLCLPSWFEPVSGDTGALLFSQCNMAWRALGRLGVQDVRVLLLFGVFFFCQVWLLHLSKIFDLLNSCCLFLPSSRHLGSLRIHAQKHLLYFNCKIFEILFL